MTPQQDTETDVGGDSAPNAVEIEADAFPDAKEGDTICLKVVSVDANGGIINATPMPQAGGESDGGSDSMAAEFSAPTQPPSQ